MNGNNIPYLNIRKKVIDLTPQEFKITYKGQYSHHFRRVREKHNIHLALKNIGQLCKLYKKISVYGVVYKITQIRNDTGVRVYNGSSLVLDDKIILKGRVRIGRAIDLTQRLKTYMKNSVNPGKTLHFEKALKKYGPKAFKIEIVAICSTRKEFESTEYFWQLYYNRKANQAGYDLRINDKFNAQLGQRSDSLYAYNLPKWEITRLILKDYNKTKVREFYATKYFIEKIDRSVLDSRLNNYFGTIDILQIKLNLAKPLIDYCINHGYSITKDIQSYLAAHGLDYYIKKLSTLTFGTHLKKIYEKEGIKFIKGEKVLKKLYLELFVKKYTSYLRSLNLELEAETKIKNLTVPETDKKTGIFINSKYPKLDAGKWGIVEHLFILGVSTRFIALILNICSYSDNDAKKEKAGRMVWFYLYTKYQKYLKNFGMKELITYLKTHNEGGSIYNDYIESLK